MTTAQTAARCFMLHERDDDRDTERPGALLLTVPGPDADRPWLQRMRDHDEHEHYRDEGRPGEDLFSQARAYARWMSGKLATTIDLFDQDGTYIVTACGGTDYWQDWNREIGTPDDDIPWMHQIGSDGWCWDCFKGDRGFVRHPVTADEAREPGWLNALPVRHGKPACQACGLGYMRPAMMAAALARAAEHPEQDNSPLDGGVYAIEYVPCSDRCAALGNGPEHKAMRGTDFCTGCSGTCCTGAQYAGPCACTDADRDAWFKLA
jgi:hypothetical protein